MNRTSALIAAALISPALHAANLGPFDVYQTKYAAALMMLPTSGMRTQYTFAVATGPTDAAVGGTLTTAFTASMARGEYEPISFTMQTSATLSGKVSFSITDLTGDGGTIPAPDIRAVKVWNQGEFSYLAVSHTAGNTNKNPVPELLLHNPDAVTYNTSNGQNTVTWSGGSLHVNPDGTNGASIDSYTPAQFGFTDSDTMQPMTMDANRLYQMWIMVHAPDDARPGVYRGTMTVSVNGQVVGTATIAVTVHAFGLEDPAVEQFIYYRGKYSSSSTEIGSENKNDTQYAAEMRDILAHGITNITSYEGYLNNWAAFRTAMNKRASYGVPMVTSVNVSFDMLASQATIEAQAALMQTELNALGITRNFIYGRDEPTAGAQMTDQITKWTALRVAGYKTFTAGTDTNMSGQTAQLDYWAVSASTSDTEAATQHANGNKICLYNRPQTTSESPHATRLAGGWGPYSVDFDCYAWYAYQHCMGDCWNDTDSPDNYRDHMFAYPTMGAPVDTLAWDGLREGIDDMRYLAALNAAITNSPYSNTQTVAAASYVATTKSAVKTDWQASTSSNLGISVTFDMDTIRATVANHIKTVHSRYNSHRPSSARRAATG